MRTLGHRIALKRVARLMRELGLSPVIKRRIVRTTLADPDTDYAPNLLARHFTAAQPN